MTNQVFNSAADILKAFPNETACITHLETLRWSGNVISPFDAYSKVYPCKNNRYRCRNTGKYFNIRTGTIFQNSRIPLQKWFLAIWIVTNHQKITSVELSQDLGLTQKTAWYMLQRIKKYLSSQPQDEKANPVKAKSKAAIQAKAKQIEVVQENDRLPVTQWLQLLKK